MGVASLKYWKRRPSARRWVWPSSQRGSCCSPWGGTVTVASSSHSAARPSGALSAPWPWITLAASPSHSRRVSFIHSTRPSAPISNSPSGQAASSSRQASVSRVSSMVAYR